MEHQARIYHLGEYVAHRIRDIDDDDYEDPKVVRRADHVIRINNSYADLDLPLRDGEAPAQSQQPIYSDDELDFLAGNEDLGEPKGMFYDDED